ncbi:PorT family protein [Muricauda oceani]|uniref:PorT family protein n=1 Tax=Flagellimonas oceani TaxID=2698672 RepID=A0A6G7J1T5_9FLAO|nr:porin family protein [Allomuricauda oceani]MBW8241434.1 PorT family protein [Allomuricauda oceani]QII44568.1 PorT family protein [Allomuricauda oceani]
MKKNLILLGVLFVGLTSFAQNTNNVQLGVRGGANFATVAGDDFDSPDSRTSFYLGLLAEAPLSDHVSLQPEVFYSAQGFDITDEPDTPDAQFQVDYIQVPVLLKFYIADGLNIHGGPQFGFKVNEELDFDPGEDSGDFDSDSINSFDFQGTAGVEYKFPSGFFIQGRYSYGFSEMIEDVDVHNSVWSAGLGFMF